MSEIRLTPEQWDVAEGRHQLAMSKGRGILAALDAVGVTVAPTEDGGAVIALRNGKSPTVARDEIETALLGLLLVIESNRPVKGSEAWQRAFDVANRLAGIE